MKLTVANRMILGFGILFLLMLSQALTAFLSQESVQTKQDYLLNELLPIQTNINHLSQRLLQANKSTMQHLSTASAEDRLAIEDEFDKIRNQFHDAKDLIQKELQGFPTLLPLFESVISPSSDSFQFSQQLIQQNNLKITQQQELLLALDAFKEEWEFYKTDIEDLNLELSSNEAQSARFSFQFLTQTLGEFNADINITLAIKDQFDLDRVLSLQHDRYETALNTASEFGDFEFIIMDKMQFYLDFMDLTLNNEAGVYAKLIPVINQQDQSAQLLEQLNRSVNEADKGFSDLLDQVMTNSNTIQSNSLAERQQSQAVQLALLILSILIAAGIVYSSVQSIKKPLKLILGSLERMTAGDLTCDLSMKNTDEFGLIAKQITVLRDNLISILKELSRVSNEVSQTTQQAIKNNQQTHQQIEHQRQESANMSQSIQQFTHSAQEVSNNAQISLSEVENLYQLAQVSSQSIGENKLSANRMEDEITNANHAIESLTNEVDGIGTIVHSIQDITSQTNLLALNASIEAARAGEHGRGFAVVADEVRALANSTQLATQDIENIVSKLKESVQRVTSSMETTQGEATSMLKIANTIDGSYEKLTSAIDLVGNSSTDISNAVITQTQMVEDLNRNIEQIVELANKIALQSSSSGERTTKLTNLVETQRQLVGKFTIQ